MGNILISPHGGKTDSAADDWRVSLVLRGGCVMACLARAARNRHAINRHAINRHAINRCPTTPQHQHSHQPPQIQPPRFRAAPVGRQHTRAESGTGSRLPTGAAVRVPSIGEARGHSPSRRPHPSAFRNPQRLSTHQPHTHPTPLHHPQTTHPPAFQPRTNPPTAATSNSSKGH